MTQWQQYDAVALINQAESVLPMRVDVGLDDPFYQEQLKPELFAKACNEKQFTYQLNLHQGYDHSYYFVASFIGEHIAFHAKHLKRNNNAMILLLISNSDHRIYNYLIPNA